MIVELHFARVTSVRRCKGSSVQLFFSRGAVARQLHQGSEGCWNFKASRSEKASSADFSIFHTHIQSESNGAQPSDRRSSYLCHRDCTPGRWCWFWPRWTPDVKGRTSSAHRCFHSHWSSSGRRSCRVELGGRRQKRNKPSCCTKGFVFSRAWMIFLGETSRQWGRRLVSYLTYWSRPPTAKCCVFAGLTKMVYSPTFLSPSLTTTSLLPHTCSKAQKDKKTNPGS